MKDLPFHISALHAAYAKGVSPVEVIEEAWRRIEAAGDPGIFLHLVDLETLRGEAAALPPFDPAAKPLWGVPFAVKDNIDAAGCPTTCACPASVYQAKEDAVVVAALRAAGAILVGKTNLDQFATGLVGVRSPYPPPKNAVDPEIVPGGSSSGSAVAVARGLVSFSLGTDTAGSGRVPAALNNIVGLKPTLGALSATGMVPACRTLDTISIFALTVGDAWTAFQAASVYDPGDAYARPAVAPALSATPPSFKVGVPSPATRVFFGDAAQEAAYEAALAELEALGGELVELDFQPFYEVAKLLYEGPWVGERWAATEEIIRDRPEEMHPVTRAIIGKAEGFSAADAFKGQYALQALKRATQPMVDGVDLMAVPTIPTFYSVADLEADPVTPNSNFGTYTNFVNLLDMCGLAVPMAARGDGRPGSLTLLAKAGRDALLASLGETLHARAGVRLGATGWMAPRGPERRPAAMADEIPLAAVGAHMSGLPLNGELTRLGARFLRATTTSADYRLHALPGGPPKRPGMVRAKDGAQIALEVWAVPTARFGEFIAGVPAPLSIGTVELADGTTVKGFLCEAAGLEGAEDVTAYGGWRAYLDAGASDAA
ncbi:allophanate hydrolase [Albimonas sp. CAU 1670]|uniref:allophanate hydrolase n=1 Tax=Albimonas sp. CAU 1670 TaxID=3032599 RepID=UPI0023DA2482|nr:allophanate hydrolase [Albimonas sp. CAU 1670]MDF2232903.1 allophanate hydrolase [Albimonas sp. CAU 1670]